MIRFVLACTSLKLQLVWQDGEEKGIQTGVV
jgi:hypothetical protein